MKRLLIAIGVAALLVLGGIWLGIGSFTPGPKSDRLACHTEVTVFERWRTAEAREAPREALQAGNYRLRGEQRFAQHMPTRLKGALSDEAIEEILIEAIGRAPQPEQSPLEIHWGLVEDDKEDPNKRNPPRQHFAGYLLASFVYDGQEVYRILIDYLEYDASDLPVRAECLIESFLTD